MLLINILLSTFALSFAETDAKPACTFLALTDNCKFYEDRKHLKEIKLSDGTSFSNPRYDWKNAKLENLPQAVQPQTQPPIDYEKQTEDLMQSTFKAQAEILNTWNTMPDGSRVSDTFKIAFNSATMYPDVRNWATSEKKPPMPLKVALPWPPDSDSAPVKLIDIKTLINFLDGLPELQREKIKGFIRTVPQPKMGNYGGGSYGDAYNPPASTSAGVQQKREQRNKELFEFAKESILEEISKGRPVEKLSPAEKAHYEKARTVALGPSALAATEPACVAGSSAFYRPADHRTFLCPHVLNAPDSQVVEFFGHEIAHSFDPCCNHFPLLKVNQAKWQEISDPHMMPDSVRENSNLVTVLKALRQPGPYFNFLLMSELEDPEAAIRGLQEHGAAEVVAPIVERSDDPTFEAQQCIQKTTNIRDFDEKAIEVTAREYSRATLSLLNMKYPAKDRAEFEAQTIEILKKFKECAPTVAGLPQIRETMAAAWGAKAAGRWLESNPPKSVEEKIAVLAYNGSRFCHPEPLAGMSEPWSVGSITEFTKKNIQQVHPEYIDRTDRVLLTDARVQRALNCNPDPEYNCLAKFGTTGPTKSSSAPKSTAESTK